MEESYPKVWPKIAFFILPLLDYTTEATSGLLCACWHCGPWDRSLRLVFASEVRREACRPLGNPLLRVY